MARIVMAMSGGVDSSVSAALLVRGGHEVIGVFMRHGEAEVACDVAETTSAVQASLSHGRGSPLLPVVTSRPDHKQGCCSASDAEDARRVAQSLNVPFYALNLSDDFARIIDYFVAEYTAARTPNPCVMCNNWLKFGKLFDYADSIDADFVATGHYARVNGPAREARSASSLAPGKSLWAVPAITPTLFRGIDATKDQSYVLFGIAREFLPRMLLPLGGYRKSEIRALAHELNLRVADKRDSQEICFVSSGDHADFIRRRRAASGSSLEDDFNTTGDIILTDGTIVGQHPGIEGFTIGQRKGLGVAMGEPYFVTRIDAETRRVVIGKREELAREELTADRVNWLIDPPTEPFRALVQIRYNSTATPATVEPLDRTRIRVHFAEPRYGIAPGQAAVCYDGDHVLGGGWIE